MADPTAAQQAVRDATRKVAEARAELDAAMKHLWDVLEPIKKDNE